MSQYKKVKRDKNYQDQSLINSIENNDVPFDIALDILMRLPVKSVARFLLVSKFWSETIRSRHFIKSFQIRSSLQQQQQPRLLVMFTDFSQDSYFFSVSSSSSSTTTSYLSRVTCPFKYSVYHSHYVNGLISLGCGRDKCIANPSTGSSTVSGGDETELQESFLGYDPVNDEYKILVCSKKSQIRRKLHKSYSHHEVVTLGDKNEQWRRIDYETLHHHPLLNCLCIDGVLYYVACIGSFSSKPSLMRFRLESEKLDLFTSLPDDVQALFEDGSRLISYKKKVALATKISDYEHEVWVLDQHEWVKKSFSISCTVHNIARRCELFISGTTLTGEFILAPRVYSDMFCVVYYNPDTKCYRQTCVEVPEDYGFKHRSSWETQAMVFSDYVDCFRFL